MYSKSFHFESTESQLPCSDRAKNGGLWPQRAFLSTLKYCGLWPHQTLVVSGCKVIWFMLYNRLTHGTLTEFKTIYSLGIIWSVFPTTSEVNVRYGINYDFNKLYMKK